MVNKPLIITLLLIVWTFACYITYSSHEQSFILVHSDFVHFILNPNLGSFGGFLFSLIYHYSTYLIGSVFILIGLYTFLKKKNSIVIINFFILMSVTGFAIIYAKPSSQNLSIAKEIEILLVSIWPYLLISFFEHFPSSKKPFILKRIKFIVLWIGLLVNIIYHLTSRIFQERLVGIIECTSFALFLNIIFAVLICLFLLKKQWDNSKWLKSQLITLFIGLILSISPLLLLTIIPGILQLPSISFSYSILSIIILPITLAYILTKQEVFNFGKYLKLSIIKILPLISTLALINFAFNQLFEWRMEDLLLVNFILLIGLGLYYYIDKKLAPLKIQNWKAKLEEMKTEKKFITQKIQDGNYLISSAKFISDVIHKIIDVDDICIIWDYNAPSIIYSLGDFDQLDEKQFLIDQFLNINKKNKKILKFERYHYIPLYDENKILGAIVLGQKSNYTAFDKDDLLILEKIQADAVDLFISAQSLNNLHIDYKRSQQAMLTIESFNALLLNELEAEKKRLSIFLHDEVLQNLLFISNKMQTLSPSDNPSIFELEKSLLDTINEIRELCSELYPIIVEDLGLDLSLKTLKRKIENNHNVNVNIHYDLPFKVFPKSISVNIYRIIKELTHNSLKHASASTIDLSIRELDHQLIITVKDNGKGFVLPDKTTLLDQNNMGLMTVQKKIDQLNGTFHIQSELNLGTSITMKFPSEWSEQIEYTSTNSR